MSLEGDIVLLSDVPLFENLSQEHLRLLAFSAVRRELPADTVLFRKGEPAYSGYVVASGLIALSAGEGEERTVVASCRRGYLIGEIPLFVESARTATAVAIEASELLELSRALVLRMMNEYPQAAMRVRSSLGDRITGTIDELRRVRETLLRPDGRR